jgi:hypothetical protein
LHHLGVIKRAVEMITVYQFEHDDNKYFALSPHYNFYPMAGMTLDDLQLQEVGSAWIASRDSIDLDTALLGDESVPRTLDRDARLPRWPAEH